MNEIIRFVFLVGAALSSVKRSYKNKKIWADPYFDPARYGGLLNEVVFSERFGFKKVLRVTMEEFNFLLERIDPLIRRANTNMRESVSSSVRLGIALRFIASGDSYESLSILTKVSHSVIVNAVPEVFKALTIILKKFMLVYISLKYLFQNVFLN